MITLSFLKNSLRHAAHLAVAVLFCSMAAFPPAAMAQTGEVEKALKVHLKNGEPQFFMLNNAPVITFEGTDCHIDASNFSAKFAMADIDHAEIVEHTSGLDQEMANALVVDLSNPDLVRIHGMNPGSEVTVFSISGMIMLRSAADSQGDLIMDISGLTPAFYIVNSRETTFKIYKK